MERRIASAMKKHKKVWKSISKLQRLKEKYKANLLNEYRNEQNVFDKRLRATERVYNNERAHEIENWSIAKPKEFWNHLKNSAHV